MLSTILPPGRLTPLCDGRNGIRAALKVDVSEPAGEQTSPCLDFVASDESLDRYHEIVSVSGWDLSHYRQNPVFQNAHQTGDIIHTLGKALITDIQMVHDQKALVQRIEFAVDINPMARIAYGLYRGKFLNAVSVGFVPVQVEPGTDKTSYRRKFTRQELLEVSAVAIPANPNALALAYKSGAVEKSHLTDLADLLHHTLRAGSDFCPLTSDSCPPTPAPSPRTPDACPPLLQLARTLHTLFRKI